VTVVRETTTIAVPVSEVYAAISDVRRMGQWSPECVGATLLGPGAGTIVGARFLGHNRDDRAATWTTRCTVTIADAPTCFAFDVWVLGRVSTWRFDLAAAANGRHTEVTQSWWDRRGPTRRWLSALVTRSDRPSRNRASMRVTLQRLKSALENPG
jgi:hypothetical protein